jgi:hypothetical protein
VEACFEDVNHWYAGSYEGTFRVYGPRITDFNYALVVTTKWPPWVALVVIFATTHGRTIMEEEIPTVTKMKKAIMDINKNLHNLIKINANTIIEHQVKQVFK